MSEKTTLLDWWLRYLKLGWPVFPLKPRSKFPLIPKEEGGRGCLDATLDEAQVRAWYERAPTANIGLATGHVFFALDVDPKKGGEDSFDALRNEHGPFPDTIQQTTGGGGFQLLYQTPDFPVPNSVQELAPGLDIRGVGGYIVAPPSIHPETGRRYAWDGVKHIEDETIAPAPAWLLDWLRGRKNAQKDRPKPQRVAEQIREGGRNTTLFKFASSLRGKGFSLEEILPMLRVMNQQRCVPPLPDRELETIAISAANRYSPDAKRNLFAGAEPPTGDTRDELPLSAADVEAAIDATIGTNDLAAAMRLIPEIAQLPIHSRALIQAKLRLKFKRDFPAREFSRAIKELVQQREELPVVLPSDDDGDPLPTDVPDLTGYPLTDSGNGERIVALHGADIRFCVEFQKWMLWDGRRWKVDDASIVTQKAKDMARLLYRQAGHLEDPGIRQIIQEHARASESQAAIVASLKRAGTEPGIAVNASELDQHRYLLNCLNGVVDVRTGELLNFERRYLITKLCHVKYVPGAPCLRFLKFLHWAMGETADDAHDREKVARMVSYLQLAFGYALTGDVSEKVAFILYGRTGNNGKTTLLTIFTTLLAEYAAQLDINTLMTTKLTDNNMRADMAKLHGARLVITSEVDDQQKLSERLLKYLTAGMGKIVACRKFENPIEFDATHKIFMDANYRPNVRGQDDPMWARLRCIPFDQHLADGDPEMDKKLKDKILAESEGVLAWAIRGAIRYSTQGGLGVPPEVREAGAAWRDADDPLKDFLEDCCETGDPHEGYWVLGSKLSTAYDQWCKDNREKYTLARGQLTERLTLKGFTQSRSRRDHRDKQMRTWEGLKLREDVTLTSSPSYPSRTSSSNA